MKFVAIPAVLLSCLLLGIFDSAALQAMVISDAGRAGAAPRTATLLTTSLSIEDTIPQVANVTMADMEYAGLPDDPGQPAAEGVAAAISPGNGASDPAEDEKQTKRILFIIPNFRAVSANQVLKPQGVKEKFVTATLDSLDYSSFIFVGLQAGLGQLDNSYPEFHQGAAGYGRYYWHTLTDSTSENYWVEFIFPVPLHEDTRFYTLGEGSLPKRFIYAFSRIAITRSDGGGETFNAAEIFGAGAAASLSNLYYPEQERTLTKTYQRWVTDIVIDGGVFVLKEFWPDINSRFFHQTD